MRRHMGRIMNKRLFYRIYNYTVNNKTAAKAAVLLSRFSKFIYVVIYGLGFIILLFGSDILLIPRYILVPFAVLVVNTSLRKILNKPRPFESEDIEALVPHEENGSLPSNHAASSLIISLSWLLVCPPVAAAFVLLSFCTGFSRIMTGIHYPLDVVCGWMIALIGGVFGFLL